MTDAEIDDELDSSERRFYAALKIYAIITLAAFAAWCSTYERISPPDVLLRSSVPRCFPHRRLRDDCLFVSVNPPAGASLPDASPSRPGEITGALFGDRFRLWNHVQS
jgi:hypothetical protein